MVCFNIRGIRDRIIKRGRDIWGRVVNRRRVIGRGVMRKNSIGRIKRRIGIRYRKGVLEMMRGNKKLFNG